MPETTEPLISIGIPTYERAGTLLRAVESALAQTYRYIEVVVYDDGSGDATEAVVRELAARDGRLRYLRSPQNRGLAENHNLLFAEMVGEYVMLLSDDDWLEPTYVERCLAVLRADSDLVLVCGQALYLDGERIVRRGIELDLTQPSSGDRILSYLRQVDENGLLYGLMPRAVLERATPLRNVLGNDWLLVMGVLAQGKATTIHTTSVRRDLGGSSADFRKLTTTLRLPGWQARIPHLVIAWQVLREVGWRGSAYGGLPGASRARLAVGGAWAAIRWSSLAWHLTMPTFAAIGQRRRGGWLWEAYRRFTRRVGAGRHS